MSEPNNIGWYIVKFIDEDTIEAVPSNWLKNFENCVWPLYTEKNKMAAAIKQKENPKDDWTSHKIFLMSKKRIMNFQQAMRLAHKATIDSELSTMEDDPQEILMKIKSRISKPNPKYSISDSEEDIPQIKINKTKTRLKIPDFPQLSESISPELLHLHNKTSKNIAEQKSHSIVKKRLSYEIDDDILPNANINKKKIIIDFPEMNSDVSSHRSKVSNTITNEQDKNINNSITFDSEDLFSDIILDSNVAVETNNYNKINLISNKNSASLDNDFQINVMNRINEKFSEVQDHISKEIRTYHNEISRILISINLRHTEMNNCLFNIQNLISNTITAGVSQEETNEDNNTLYNSFPISSIADFNEIDQKLDSIKGTQLFSLLVKKMALVGGNSEAEYIRRLMRKTLSDEVAANFSLKGKQKKMSFLSTTSSYLLKCAIRLKYPDLADKNIEGIEGVWLAKAKERLKFVSENIGKANFSNNDSTT